MRAKASKIVTLLVACCGSLSTLHALEAKPVSHKPAPAAALKAGRPEPAPALSKSRANHATIASSHSAKRSEAKAVERHPAPVPIVRDEPDEEMLKAKHDRRQHFSAEPGTPEAETEVPRKATAADFLTSFAEDAASNQPLTKVQPEPMKHKPEVAPSAAPAPKAAKAEPAVVVANLYDKKGQLVVPPALKGSHEILVHQNEMADHDGLDRIKDDDELDNMRERKLLVPVPLNAGLQLNEGLPANRRYCRPWTAQFLVALARAHYARFHTALQVNSAVRTVEVQERLLLTNGNAAPAEGATASPHLTGQAIDLAKRGLSLTEIAWLRGYLLPLVQAGKVDVEEEFQQACFHVSVYRKYVPQPAPKREIAAAHRAQGTVLAAAIR